MKIQTDTYVFSCSLIDKSSDVCRRKVLGWGIKQNSSTSMLTVNHTCAK